MEVGSVSSGFSVRTLEEKLAKIQTEVDVKNEKIIKVQVVLKFPIFLMFLKPDSVRFGYLINENHKFYNRKADPFERKPCRVPSIFVNKNLVLCVRELKMVCFFVQLKNFFVRFFM